MLCSAGKAVMDVKWYGTATMEFADGESKILFDPFLRRNPLIKKSTTELEGFTGRSAVFITHGHFDHIWDVPQLLEKDKNVTVYCTAAAAENLKKLGVSAERLQTVDHGDSFHIGAFTVTAYRAKHVSFSPGYIASVVPRCVVTFPVLFKMVAWSIKCPLKDEIMMYEIENGGKRVLLSGSFGWCEDVNYPSGADMFVLAHGGNTKLAEIVTPFLHKTKPAKVFMSHYDDAFPPLTRRVNVERTCKIYKNTFPQIETIIPQEKTVYTV